MEGRLVHQWRDWHLQYISENKYKLIHIKDNSIQTIIAKDDLEAENKSRSMIEEIEKGLTRSK